MKRRTPECGNFSWVLGDGRWNAASHDLQPGEYFLGRKHGMSSWAHDNTITVWELIQVCRKCGVRDFVWWPLHGEWTTSTRTKFVHGATGARHAVGEQKLYASIQAPVCQDCVSIWFASIAALEWHTTQTMTTSDYSTTYSSVYTHDFATYDITGNL